MALSLSFIILMITFSISQSNELLQHAYLDTSLVVEEARRMWWLFGEHILDLWE
jgi:hypothetical protein